MLFLYVFTLLRSTTVWTRDAKDGKQAVYYGAISLVQTGLDCDIPVSTSRVPGVTFWSTQGIWCNIFLNSFTFYYIYLFSYVYVHVFCMCVYTCGCVSRRVACVYSCICVYVWGYAYICTIACVWMCMSSVCTYVCTSAYMSHHTWEGQEDTLWQLQFCPSTMCVPGIQLRSSVLAPRALQAE